MRRAPWCTFGCLISLVLVSVLLTAQAPAGIVRGIVTDASGGVLPGALVTLVGPAPALTERTAATDERGEYRFIEVVAGSYELQVSLSGFQSVKTAFTMESAVAKSMPPITLALGTVRETLTVTGAAPVVDVQNASRVTTLERATQDSLPVGRNIWEMATAIPGVGITSAGGTAQSYTSVHGLSGAQNVGLVDGMTVNCLGCPSSHEQANTESYDKIDENSWQTVSTQPLSTFSVDVDTASYANVRHFLTGGQLPPKDAVRIEELINYFSYDYPEPRNGEPFAVATALGDCPWNPQHRLALIGLQAKRLSDEDTPPRNLVFLIDVSGSMMPPNKLPLVKASLSLLARNLTARDRIAIVVYAGAAGLVLPTTAGNDTATILQAIGRLQAGGSTNGGQGIALAYKIARDQFIAGGVNRVLLATDGDFNVGISNQGDLIRLIEDQRESGVFLSIFGYGRGNLKDSTMEKLADRGNGNYAYIDSLEEAKKVLVHEAGGTLITVAKDVKLQIEFNPRLVSSYRLVGYENRILADQDFNDDRKDAGDMGAGHSVTALYEIVPANQSIDTPDVDPLKYQRTTRPTTAQAASDELMTVKLRYKAPDGDTSSLLSTIVTSRTRSNASLGFAAAVAEFGMVLRDSAFKGHASYASAFARATRHKESDPYGHRAEFIRLIGKAEALAQSNR